MIETKLDFLIELFRTVKASTKIKEIVLNEVDDFSAFDYTVIVNNKSFECHHYQYKSYCNSEMAFMAIGHQITARYFGGSFILVGGKPCFFHIPSGYVLENIKINRQPNTENISVDGTVINTGDITIFKEFLSLMTDGLCRHVFLETVGGN